LLLRGTEEDSLPRSLCLDALVLLWSEEEHVFAAVEGWTGRREGGKEGGKEEGKGMEEVKVFLDDIGKALRRDGGAMEETEGKRMRGEEEAAAFPHSQPVVVAVNGSGGVEMAV